MRLSPTAWRILGAIACVAGFQLLKDGVGRAAGYIFVGVVTVAAVVLHLVYQRRLQRLRDDVADLSEDERRRFLQEIDPEILEDLRKKEKPDN
jgi:O-antigen/teichoic acid export membrane protein